MQYSVHSIMISQ